ncbi:MAG: PLP-dependent aminotransferase family protein [Oscillospiraceae bacterium]|nr:PLP-dependent aminotransferase family protein [Oscillospiraceae bacterium]
MKYNIRWEQSSPAYLQLYTQLRQDIVQGLCPHGSKLPSKRTLAEELGISTVTVEHSYALLCDEGYVESRQRSGYFVIFRTDDGFAGSSMQPVPIQVSSHSHGLGEFPLSLLAKTMRRVMNDYGSLLLEPSENGGRGELREAIRQYLARSRGIRVDREQILIGSGAEYLYSLIPGLLGREKLYAIEAPSYRKIEQTYRLSNVPVTLLPLGPDGIESPALWASEAQVLHISPYRSFPSGVSASASKRHEYLRWVGKEDRYIIEDDFESEFSVSKKPEDTLFSQCSQERVIYLNSFSKTISPSLRVGYMVLPPALLPRYRDTLGFLSCTVPTFEQLVLAELLSGGEFERHINRVRRQKRKALQQGNQL